MSGWQWHVVWWMLVVWGLTLLLCGSWWADSPVSLGNWWQWEQRYRPNLNIVGPWSVSSAAAIHRSFACSREYKNLGLSAPCRLQHPNILWALGRKNTPALFLAWCHKQRPHQALVLVSFQCVLCCSLGPLFVLHYFMFVIRLFQWCNQDFFFKSKTLISRPRL